MTDPSLRTLLVPTDFSKAAAAAVEYALWLAARSHANVAFLHVMEPAVYSVDFALTHPGISAEVKQGALKALRNLNDEARSRGVHAETVLTTGTPFAVITSVAVERKADLIVMGTHGRSGLAHVMLGSTAERVIRLAPCPVLTVKAEPPGPGGSPVPEREVGVRAGR